MFTGIIETVGRVISVKPMGAGLRFQIEAPFASELRVDDSVSVSGACQTVVARDETTFEVVAIEETLKKTNLGSLKPGAPVNPERAMQLGGRLDGHMVQGHVDATVRLIPSRQMEPTGIRKGRKRASKATVHSQLVFSA